MLPDIVNHLAAIGTGSLLSRPVDRFFVLLKEFEALKTGPTDGACGLPIVGLVLLLSMLHVVPETEGGSECHWTLWTLELVVKLDHVLGLGSFICELQVTAANSFLIRTGLDFP